MNAKQFVNSVICELLERWQGCRRVLRWFSLTFFPNFFPFSIRPNWRGLLSRRGIALTFLVVFVLLFVVQAGFAALSGRLLPDSRDNTKQFLEDTENLVNYSAVCELYVILGAAFLAATYDSVRRLRRSGLTKALRPASIELRPGGTLAATLVLVIALLATARYAVETEGYSSQYWFMEQGPPSVTFGLAGYYYILVNFLLLAFVLWVAFAHFGYARIGMQITSGLRAIADRGKRGEQELWGDDHRVKLWLAPFSQQVLLSKLFVSVLVMNLLTWRKGEAHVGLNYYGAVVVAIGVGVFVLSLPRYAIQYQVFRIWKRLGKEDYRDVRTSWILGASAALDVILFSYVAKILLGDALTRLMDQYFS